MYKFAFTYLVRQDKKTWNNLSTSLYLLNKIFYRESIANLKY